MSEVASKTQLAMQLMLLDDATKQDLFTKYALLADAYIGSAGKNNRYDKGCCGLWSNHKRSIF